LNISIVVYGKKNDKGGSTVMTSYTTQSQDGGVKESYNVIPNIYLGLKISDNNDFKNNTSVFLSPQNVKSLFKIMKNLPQCDIGANAEIAFNAKNVVMIEKTSDSSMMLFLNGAEFFVSMNNDDFEYFMDFCEHSDLNTAGLCLLNTAIMLGNDQTPVASSSSYSSNTSSTPKVSYNQSTASTKNSTGFTPSNKSSATVVQDPKDDDIPF
jgi:hypothetical protein